MDIILNRCLRNSKIFNDDFSIPINVTGKVMSTLGYCTIRKTSEGYKPISLTISKRVMNCGDYTTIIQIIDHEWAHYYATKKYKLDADHGKIFQEICKRISNNPFTYQPTMSIPRNDNNSKYTVTCSKCGEHWYFDKSNKIIKNGGYHCGCKVTIKQNW